MKKNLKIVSLAAAALLAVSPVVASGAINSGSSVVKAAPATDTNRPYFANVGGVPQADKSTLNYISAAKFKTVQDIVDAVNNNVTWSPNGSNGSSENPKITSGEVYSQLIAQHIKVNTSHLSATDKSGKHYGKATISNLPANFTITVSKTIPAGHAYAGTYTTTVPFYTTSKPSVDTTAPEFYVSTNNGTPTKVSSSDAYYQVAAGSNFNPLSFTESDGKTITFSAQQASNNSASANVTVASNPVNTSEEGRFFTVRLSATNIAGKTSSYSYTVLVVSNGLQKVYANGASSIPTYSIYGDEVSANSTTFKDGQQVYVGNTTRTINNVSYSKVSTKSKADADAGNLWIQTSSLTSKAPAEQSKTYRVMVTSKAYDKNGNYLGHNYDYNTNINIVPTVVTINGKTYYKVAGKDEYVRVTNITGTVRRVRHNAYVYRSSYRRNWNGKIKYYRGQYVHTYGAAITFRNGKKYYRIDGCSPSNKRYLKVANF